MFRRSFILLFSALIFTLLSAAALSTRTARADDANAWANAHVNLRSAPNLKGEVLTIVDPGTPLVIEARDRAANWLLVHAQSTPTARGWAAKNFLKIAPGIKLFDFMTSAEELASSASVATPTPIGTVDLDKVPVYQLPIGPLPNNIPQGEINAPIIPVITPRIRYAMRAVYIRGLRLGNNPRVFAKVGDCHTDHPSFFNEIGLHHYNLGQYGGLQGIIDYYSVPPREGLTTSFNTQSQAAHSAFTAGAVLDWQWANPQFCVQNPNGVGSESPLRCEYRIDKPSVSLIMFGVNDVLTETPQQFNTFMRYIVKDTLDRGIIPVLSTAGENTRQPEKARQFNQIVVTIAKEKSLPLINLEAALASLPNKGMDGDGIHLSRGPLEQTAFFDDANLKNGYTMRNLITLEALDVIQKQIMYK
jgi:hypothetical protein